jgi:hypothetical protein
VTIISANGLAQQFDRDPTTGPTAMALSRVGLQALESVRGEIVEGQKIVFVGWPLTLFSWTDDRVTSSDAVRLYFDRSARVKQVASVSELTDEDCSGALPVTYGANNGQASVTHCSP